MSLFTKLFEAVHSWRRRRDGVKSRKRADLAMEQLDHRQLMAVNFTGVVATDFPATQSPGVVVIPSPAGNQKPLIPTSLQGVVNVSGIEIDQLRVSYTAADDTLSVGIEGPANGRDGREVIAADSDNNGNSATVDPRISNNQGTGLAQGFQDPADFGGTKSYGILLALRDPNTPDIAAGFPITSPDSTSGSKPYEVAVANNNISGPNSDRFVQNALLPQYTGNYFTLNDPNKPNVELQIAHFSQLYQQVTGTALTTTSPISIGAFASNAQDGGISDEFFPPQAISTPQATVPPPVVTPPVVCPPLAPTIYVNPHENYHLNTAHPTAIRVSVLGSSGFDPTTIIPSTVRFGDSATITTTGTTPILNYERNVNNDQFPDETFVFNGLKVNLPSGETTATITGTTTSGQTFSSSVQVFNRDNTYYTAKEQNLQEAAWVKYDNLNKIPIVNGVVVPPPPTIPKAAQQRAASMAINDLYNPFQGVKVPKQAAATSLGTATPAASTASSVTVAIPTKKGKVTKASAVHVNLGASSKKGASLTQILTGGQ